MDSYLPNDISDVIIWESDKKEYTVVLEKDELVLGNISVRRMELGEFQDGP